MKSFGLFLIVGALVGSALATESLRVREFNVEEIPGRLAYGRISECSDILRLGGHPCLSPSPLSK